MVWKFRLRAKLALPCPGLVKTNKRSVAGLSASVRYVSCVRFVCETLTRSHSFAMPQTPAADMSHLRQEVAALEEVSHQLFLERVDLQDAVVRSPR